MQDALLDIEFSGLTKAHKQPSLIRVSYHIHVHRFLKSYGLREIKVQSLIRLRC